MQKRFLLGTVCLIGLVVYLAVDGLRGGRSPVLSVAELRNSADEFTGRRIRLMGFAAGVDPRRIRRDFQLEFEAASRAVVYTGSRPLPERLADGVQTMATGVLRPDGAFEARVIRCKCASRYEAEDRNMRRS